MRQLSLSYFVSSVDKVNFHLYNFITSISLICHSPNFKIYCSVFDFRICFMSCSVLAVFPKLICLEACEAERHEAEADPRSWVKSPRHKWRLPRKRRSRRKRRKRKRRKRRKRRRKRRRSYHAAFLCGVGWVHSSQAYWPPRIDYSHFLFASPQHQLTPHLIT